MIYLLWSFLARVLAPDLDSYLLARGHPPTMGRKEQEKKAKRAAAGPSDAPPCKAAAPKPPVPKVDTPAAGSGSRPSSASSGAVEAESLVAVMSLMPDWPVEPGNF